jgi:deoxyadenosine/deoxycytidine kinase
MPLIADKWILLNTSLNESINRIIARNRVGEHKIDLEYQKNLYTKHLEFYNKLQNDGKTISIIDSCLMDANFVTDSCIFNKIVHQIIEMDLSNSH